MNLCVVVIEMKTQSNKMSNYVEILKKILYNKNMRFFSNNCGGDPYEEQPIPAVQTQVST